MTVTLDSPKGRPARVVSFIVGGNAEAGEFNALRHALAGTVWKEQGKTKTETLALHSDHWRSASSYVALSRFTDNVHIFATEKPAPWIMATGGHRRLERKAARGRGAELRGLGRGEARPREEIRRSPITSLTFRRNGSTKSASIRSTGSRGK